jgi:adiponectin receptor
MKKVCAEEPRVGTYLEAPGFLRVPYILSGYRLNHHIKDCLESLFGIHNETVNIWTHIIGATFAFYFLYRLIAFDYREGIMNFLMPLVYDFGFGYSLALSSVFHGFNCINEHYHYTLRIADFCGIGVAILGSCAPVAYYTFTCSPLSLFLWLGLVTILFPLFLWMPFATFFHDKRMLRTMLFVVAALIPFFCIAQYWLMYGFGQRIEKILFYKVLETYFWYGLGIILYVTRIPEKFWPGSFDTFGASHQLWHVLCAYGMYRIHLGVYDARDFRLSDWACLNHP